MEILICPHCAMRVAVTPDGQCPSCRRPVTGAPDEAVGRTDYDAAEVRQRSVAENRPTSVTAISWFLIVTSVCSLIATLISTATGSMNDPAVRELMAKNPLPIPVQIGLAYAGSGVMFVCGLGMLGGRNWARWLYVIWNVTAFVVGAVTSPWKAMMIPGLVVFLVIVFFLFRPNATAYFTHPRGCDETGL